jgi:SAM-dependent methyltransferase
MDKRNSLVKQAFELDHWVRVYDQGGSHPFDGRHPAAVGTFDKYCQLLGLSRSSFAGQVVIDLGCGAYGSLHFFEARLKFGLDILSHNYVPLGIHAQDMIYLSAPAEDMPFVDEFADAVLAVNSLDHVDDFPAAIRELSRVLKVGGRAFLAFNLNNPVTLEEPNPRDQAGILREVGRWLEVVRQQAWEAADLPGGMAAAAPNGLLTIEARRADPSPSSDVQLTQRLLAEAASGVPVELRLLRLAQETGAARPLLGNLFAAAAFVELQRANAPQARRNALWAFAHSPGWLFNRGLWSIALGRARAGRVVS